MTQPVLVRLRWFRCLFPTTETPFCIALHAIEIRGRSFPTPVAAPSLPRRSIAAAVPASAPIPPLRALLPLNQQVHALDKVILSHHHPPVAVTGAPAVRREEVCAQMLDVRKARRALHLVGGAEAVAVAPYVKSAPVTVARLLVAQRLQAFVVGRLRHDCGPESGVGREIRRQRRGRWTRYRIPTAPLQRS